MVMILGVDPVLVLGGTVAVALFGMLAGLVFMGI